MMTALKGTIHGNSVIIEGRNMEAFQGMEAVVTIINVPASKKRKKLDLLSYVTPTERGQNADEYMKEMRENDRI